MELVAITKARALAMIELDGMNLGGKIRLSDCIPPLLARYDFKIFPTKSEELDLSKGVRFESGRTGEFLIDAMVVFDGAVFVDTLASTDTSTSIIRDLFQWGRDELGLTYNERQIRRWGYISDLVFHTDFPLLEWASSPLDNLARKVSSITEEKFEGLKYRPVALNIGHDPAARLHAIAGLTIQHRVNTSHGENIFFSEAPLPTDIHMKFLAEFESEILESRR